MSPRLMRLPMPPHRVSQGVSLIELMIAMALGLVIVATIGFSFVGAKSSFKSQVALSTIQENARYAFEFMGNDIRMAGYTGSTKGASFTQPGGWSETRDLQGFPLRGYEDGVSTFPTFPVARPRLTGDAIVVVRVDNDKEYALDDAVSPNPDSGVFTLEDWPSSHAPQSGGYFVAADYTNAAAFTLSNVNSGAKTLTTTDGLGTFYGPIGARKVFPISGAIYYIANNPAGEPSLYRYRLTSDGTDVAEELVEGVQTMNIVYGVDTDATADANVNAYWTADQVEAGTDGTTPLPAGTATDYWKRVLSVRVTVTLTTKSTERITTNLSQLTKQFTTTFAVRNRL